MADLDLEARRRVREVAPAALLVTLVLRNVVQQGPFDHRGALHRGRNDRSFEQLPAQRKPSVEGTVPVLAAALRGPNVEPDVPGAGCTGRTCRGHRNLRGPPARSRLVRSSGRTRRTSPL